MMGRKTLREVREQLEAARAGVPPKTAGPDAIAALEQLADDLRRTTRNRDEQGQEPGPEAQKPV